MEVTPEGNLRQNLPHNVSCFWFLFMFLTMNRILHPFLRVLPPAVLLFTRDRPR